MTTDSILISVAQDLGKSSLVKYLKSGVSADVENDENDKQRLLKCLNTVLGELYRTKSKTYYTQDFNGESGYIPISEFAFKPLKIHSVTINGEKVLYDILPEGLQFSNAAKITVTYLYLPDEAEEGDEIVLSPSVSERAVKYGCLAEYCLSSGIFEEAALWRAQYERELSKVLKCGYIKDRRLI